MRNLWKRAGCLFLALCAVLTLTVTATESAAPVRRRLIIAIDGSGSLMGGYYENGVYVNGSDPDGVRFKAIEDFLDFLRKRTNEEYEIGYVIFSDDVKSIVPAQALTDSNPDLERAVLEARSAQRPKDWTNIGAGLKRAVELAHAGNPSYKSAVLFFSDGKMDMGPANDPATPRKMEESRLQELSAIQEAEQYHIPILSLFLNGNNEGGEEGRREMREISSNIDERYKEVLSDERLANELFSMLTAAIGVESPAVPTNDDDPPLTLPIDFPFEAPGFGLDSLEIMLTDRSFADFPVIRLTCEDENITYERDELLANGADFINVPVTDHPRRWNLHIEGASDGDSVRLRLLHNHDLQVNIDAPDDPDGKPLDTASPISITATLEANGVTANTESQYSAFDATLIVQDRDGMEVRRTPMGIDTNHFQTEFQAPEDGTYTFLVQVSAPQDLTVTEGGRRERTFSIEPFKRTSNPVTRTFMERGPVDNPPVTPNVPVTLPPVTRGDTLDHNLRDDVSDEDPDTLTYEVIHAPNGVTVAADGRVHADNFDVPGANFVAMSFRVTDAAGQSGEVALSVPLKDPENQYPTGPKDPYEVKIQRGKTYEVNLSALVSDPEDNWTNMDCVVTLESGNVYFTPPSKSDPYLTVENARDCTLRVTVTDSAGAPISFRIVLKTWTWPGRILPFVVPALLVLIALLVLLLIAKFTRPYHGSIKITVYRHGAPTKYDPPSQPRRGPFYFSHFQIPDLESSLGLMPGKCYFRPAPNRCVDVYLSRPGNITGAFKIYGDPRKGAKKARIQSKHPASVRFPDRQDTWLSVEFESKEKTRPPKTPKAPKGPNLKKQPRPPQYNRNQPKKKPNIPKKKP